MGGLGRWYRNRWLCGYSGRLFRYGLGSWDTGRLRGRCMDFGVVGRWNVFGLDGLLLLGIVDGEKAGKGANMYQDVGISSLAWTLVCMKSRGKHS